MIRNAIKRHALAALFFAAILVGVTHFHFPANVAADGEAAVSHSACGCTHNHHQPYSPGDPSDSDCHYCKLISQLSAEMPVVVDVVMADPLSNSSVDFEVARPVAVASVYLGRGPPKA